MRILRLIIAVLLTASLAVSPALASVGAMHAAHTEMSMGASDDCPCCDPADMSATDACKLMCYQVPALPVEGTAVMKSVRQWFIAAGLGTLSPFSVAPDPPPPRS